MRSPFHAQLELVCLRDGSVKVASANREVELAPRSAQRLSAAGCLGQFFEFTHAYRFGPHAHDVTIATLRDTASGRIVSEAFHFPERHVVERHELGLTIAAERNGDGLQLVIKAQRFAGFVHIVDTHYRAAHQIFRLPPNRPRIVPLIALTAPQRFVACASNAVFKADATSAIPAGEVRAANAISATFHG